MILYSKLVDNFATFFVLKISTLIADMHIRPLELQDRLTSSITAILSAGYLATGNSDLCLTFLVKSRIFDHKTIREGGKCRQAQVDADWFNGNWQWFDFPFDAETSEPATGIALDRESFDLALHRSVQFDFDVTSALYSEFSCIKQLVSVTGIREGQTVVTP